MHHRLLLVLASFASFASAQYVSDFEPLTGSSTGTSLTGQDGYYNPVAGSLDWNVYTYAGNPHGVPAHPTGGGNQFVAGLNTGAALARAQRNVAFNATTPWRVSFDVCCGLSGVAPALQNLGSFSLQPSTTNAHFIALARWTDVNTATAWNADFVHFPANGTTSATVVVPDPNFQNLATNRWYRWTVDWDFANGRVLAIRLQDLTGGPVHVYEPPDWFLRSGPIATDFRFFTGGGVATNGSNNLFAVDNIRITPLLYGDMGTGCAGTAGTPRLEAFLNTQPQLGTTFLAGVTNLAAPEVGVMMTGFSNTSYLGNPLPVDLASFGAPGCMVRAAPESTTLVIGGGGQAVWPLTIPNLPSLAGVRFYNQFAAFDIPANALGLTVSNGARGCIL